MPEQGNRRQHFVLEHVTKSEVFRGKGGGERSAVPPRNRALHSKALSDQLSVLKPLFEQAKSEQEAVGLDGGFGLQIEFESFPDVDLAFEQLANERTGIELLNVRHEKAKTLASVFVPDGQLAHFERLIAEYLEEKADKNGKPRDHQRLIDAIRQIRHATLRALWTDDPSAFPLEAERDFWWEVWLPARDDQMGQIERFRQLAVGLKIHVAEGELLFPERTVLLLRSTPARLSRSMMTLNSIAELRAAKVVEQPVLGLTPAEQPEWIGELLDRTSFAPSSLDVPHVCILDSGINRSHPLLERSIEPNDLHAVDPNHGVHDEHGHGTEMAGLALFGDLKPVLLSAQPVVVGHRLESVKLLRYDGENGNDSRHHGWLTVEAVGRVEIEAADRARVFSMALAARENRDRGRPSAWSAALDRLAADVDGGARSPRLFVICAGNINDNHAWEDYPASNSTEGVLDPGQAWNALTVGASTELIDIADDDAAGYTPTAPSGGLSPFSTTSRTWPSHWPVKPDVVFEGGNSARDRFSACPMPSLSLVTTHFRPMERLLTTSNATSAATALAGKFAAELMSMYPSFWPETIRGLLVHSASWTETMKQQFLPTAERRGDYLNLIRHCGYGVPSMERAMWTVDNSLTMVVQSELQPFQRMKNAEPSLREMHLVTLPWPKDELEALGEQEVELRVTLSYFVDPNPSERGFRTKYRYHSHGLRFEVKGPTESVNSFRARVNAAARDEEEGAASSGGDPGWLIGSRNRHKGSIHCDIWRGAASDLASREVLAVYPTGGWWKTRRSLERYNQRARYALLVSIHAPDIDVDLATAIEQMVETAV